MPDFLKSTVDKVSGYFAKLEKGQKVRFTILLVFMISVLVSAAILLNQRSYSVLYSGMKPEDAGKVMNLLQEMNVDAKTRGSDTILVENSTVDQVRMELAAQGYPNSGFNYDIFAKAAGLGTTDMEKKVYYQFQLQEHIRQTLLKMNKVDDAVVTLSLPEESLFVLEEHSKPATAAVMLMLVPGEKLARTEVRAIAELVATSISGLKTDDVRIVDSQMNLYEVNQEDEIGNINSQMELAATVKNNLQQQIKNLLCPVFGPDHVLAEVNVQLNFDKSATESIEFAPPQGSEAGLAASLSEFSEKINNMSSGGVAGIDPNGAAPEYPAGDLDGGSYEKISRDVTYRLNETKTLLERAQGKIEDLSVAVILDSASGAAGYIESVQELVARAVGVAADSVTIQMMPFWQEAGLTDPDQDPFKQQTLLMTLLDKGNTRRTIILALAGIVIMLLALLMVLSLRSKEPVYDYYYGQEQAYMPGAPLHMAVDEDLTAQATEPEAPRLDFDSKDTNLNQLEEYIDKSPEAVAQLLKSWLSDE